MFWPRRPLEAKHNAFFGASEQLSKVRVWPVSLAQAPARRTSSISGLLLPVEHNAAAVAEVALVLIALGKVIAEPSQYKSTCAGRIEKCWFMRISRPPPMAKSKALLLGVCAVVVQGPPGFTHAWNRLL